MHRRFLMLLLFGLTLGGLQAFAQSAAAPLTGYSADALYNQANAYARAGKPGFAVLNYERAALLSPGDADINANLQSVRAAARVAAQPLNLFARVVLAVNPTLAAWTGVLGMILAGMRLVTSGSNARIRRALSGGALLGVALMMLSAGNAALLWPRLHDAVVLVDQTAAHVAPAAMADTVFVLPEAETVRLGAEHGDFVLVRTRAGQSGWVTREQLGAVIPQDGDAPR